MQKPNRKLLEKIILKESANHRFQPTLVPRTAEAHVRILAEIVEGILLYLEIQKEFFYQLL